MPFWARQVDDDDKIPTFLVFQGGGAKGIVHVGALTAIEDEKLSIHGVAGTSAGAMVAALVAAGYKGRELFDADTETHILGALGPKLGFTKAIDFFGWGPWQLLRFCRMVAPRFIAFVVGAFALAFAALSFLDGSHPDIAKVIGVVLCLAAVGLGYWLSTGITTVRRVRDFIEHALERKLRAKLGDANLSGSRGITFRHLAQAGGFPLSIVATNVTDKCGEVFSFERTPEVRVADAVAASICLPGVFRPWRFSCTRRTGIDADTKERRFLDGGFISNLPVWTLDAARELVDDSVTIAFGIVPDKPFEQSPREGHWLGAIGSSVIAGTMELDMRGVENVVHVPIACKLKLLDFDAGVAKFRDAVAQSRVAVRERLREDLTVYPSLMDEACDDICGEVKDMIAATTQIWASQAGFKVKAALALQPRGHYDGLAVPYGCGFEAPPDPDGYVSDAWQTGQYAFVNLPSDGEWAGSFWRLTAPCSRRRNGGELPRINGRLERPLVIVVEFALDLQPSADPTSPAFAAFVGSLNGTVLQYVNESGLYDAVQRSTSSPWH
ncbi:patatin-like phospholipase family protein [Burkholderia sp. SCN-KJ]|uniref:patatin-like phospholipase family protein n=1 Tax=Burkholderia sp. SCN-KJ TaxID=2969248 RepID=UPI00214FCA9F|nr:patatin-like phospholipase family protein [Burkholderia sp. SCN-KJ]MCR4470040.1 patatin-like phospholipase family protein [Burkholderia sp. SCN-KJ]